MGGAMAGKNYAFYVSGNASRFKKFTTTQFFNEIKKTIKFVFNDNERDVELEQTCLRHDIPVYVFKHRNADSKLRNAELSSALKEQLDANRIDYCFVFGNRILVGSLLTKYENRLINFHPSLLPAFKGRKAIDQAIDQKSFLLGNTAHFITANVDAGPIIMQSLMHSSTVNTYDDLLDKQIYMLAQIISWLNRDLIRVSDGEALVVGAGYEVGCFIPSLESPVRETVDQSYKLL